MSRFEQQYNQLRKEESFSPTEIGFNHPLTNGFIKLADNGDIEITACQGLSILMHPQNKSITFVADSIKFLVKDHDAIKINDLILNTDATNYVEPTFIRRDPEDIPYLYDHTFEYIDGPDDRRVIDPETELRITWDQYIEKYKRQPVWNGSYFE